MQDQDKYSQELVAKYLKELQKQYPDAETYLLEVAILQYLLLDCKGQNPDDNNSDYLRAKELHKQTEFKAVLLDGEYETLEKDDSNIDKIL